MTSNVRGCGTRVHGGIYAECGLGPHGLPVEYFLVDPPILIHPDEIGLTAIGVKQIGRPNKADSILDWIGADSYPNVQDFIEEARAMGVSRRLARNLDYRALKEGSVLLCVHPKAHIINYNSYLLKQRPEYLSPLLVQPYCPKGKAQDAKHRSQMCAGLWREDVTGGDTVLDPDLSVRVVDRTIPARTYRAARRPDDVEPRYASAIFASFPIRRLVVINDPVANTHEDALAKVYGTGLPVEVEDE